MYGKKDTALLQYQTPQQASTAVSYYTNIQFRDSTLRVNFSKCASIQLPRPGTENVSPMSFPSSSSPLLPLPFRRRLLLLCCCCRLIASSHTRFPLSWTTPEKADATKDYSDSPLHRFNGKPGQNLFPPCPCLFVNGILNTTTREELITLFSDFGKVADVELLAFVSPSFLHLPIFPFSLASPPSEKSAAFVQMSSISEALEALIGLHNHTFAGKRLRISFAKTTLRSVSSSSVPVSSSSSSAPEEEVPLEA